MTAIGQAESTPLKTDWTNWTKCKNQKYPIIFPYLFSTSYHVSSFFLCVLLLQGPAANMEQPSSTAGEKDLRQTRGGCQWCLVFGRSKRFRSKNKLLRPQGISLHFYVMNPKKAIQMKATSQTWNTSRKNCSDTTWSQLPLKTMLASLFALYIQRIQMRPWLFNWKIHQKAD